MSKNILIIGCSYSSGSYKSIIDNAEIKHWPHWQTPDIKYNDKGWWYFVNYFKNHNIDIMTFPGAGYWTFYQALLVLEEYHQIDKYDEIWIQETKESRPVITNAHKLSHAIVHPTKRFDNYTTYYHESKHDMSFSGFGLSPKELKIHKNYYIWKNSFFHDITIMATEKIQKICKKYKIKGVVWSMWDEVMVCDYFNRIKDISNVWHKVQSAQLLTTLYNFPGAHQTEEGNIFIANIINKNYE